MALFSGVKSARPAFAKSAGYAKMMPWSNDMLGEGPLMTYEMKL
jgi:hypothetical protein